MKTIRITAIISVLCLLIGPVAYAGIFPSSEEVFGDSMPSLSFAINKEPDDEIITDNAVIQTYTNFTDADYGLFSHYLGKKYTADSFEVIDGYAKIVVSKEDKSIIFTYNRKDKSATVEYPQGTREEKEAQTPAKNYECLPALQDLFGEDELPSLSKVLDRAPNKTTVDNGIVQEVYHDFSIDNYQQFSSYLSEYGCVVVDSNVDNNIMTVNLKMGDTDFVFIYDYAANDAYMEYAETAQCEVGVTPSPTPKPIQSKKPSTVSTPKAYYSESECYSIAERYLKNQSWKNPDSLTIHGHTTSYKSGTYTFLIDFSAQNGFGGYNRETFMISVDEKTGSVTLGFKF